MNKWWAVENTKKTMGSVKCGDFFLSEELLAAEERHCFLDLFSCDVCQLPTQN